MESRFNYSINLTNKTRDEITEYLRKELANRTTRKSLVSSRNFWIGFAFGCVFGCVFIAAMDFGDVHFCVGQCDGKGGFQAPQLGAP